MKKTKTKSRSETKARPARRNSEQNVPYRKPALRSDAFARALIDAKACLNDSESLQALFKEAAQKGHRLVVLVGDEAYYEKCGFKRIPRGRAIMPGPVDPARLLIAELSEGAFDGVSGPVRPD